MKNAASPIRGLCRFPRRTALSVLESFRCLVTISPWVTFAADDRQPLSIKIVQRHDDRNPRRRPSDRGRSCGHQSKPRKFGHGKAERWQKRDGPEPQLIQAASGEKDKAGERGSTGGSNHRREEIMPFERAGDEAVLRPHEVEQFYDLMVSGEACTGREGYRCRRT